jgi:succinate dehydrogenase / fumarate reductase cytochrome b subunit
MSATAVASTVNRTVGFYEATIGKKVVMAVTGCILFLFVVGHLIGNLQIYLGPERLNNYAETLHSLGSALWVIRLSLLAIVALHIVSALQLWLLNRAARPERYRKQGWVQASYASRTMIWSGPLLAAFVTYHLLHFTTGHAHPSFNYELDVYSNVVRGFQQAPVAVSYMIAMVLLGFHLWHGLWSMFQSVGVNHPRYTPLLKRLAMLAAVVIVAGNISIPVSVLTGFIR